MRFLAGLAVLALGCLSPAAPVVEAAAAPTPVTVAMDAPAAATAPAAAVPAAATAPAAAASAAAGSHEVRAADRVEPCWNGAHTVVPAAPADVPAGVVPGAYGSRGPPVARV